MAAADRHRDARAMETSGLERNSDHKNRPIPVAVVKAGVAERNISDSETQDSHTFPRIRVCVFSWLRTGCGARQMVDVERSPTAIQRLSSN